MVLFPRPGGYDGQVVRDHAVAGLSYPGRYSSNRVAIGLAIEAELGKRQGQRTDLAGGELVDNYPQVGLGQKTREIAADKAGFGSEFTYRQAEKVNKNAVFVDFSPAENVTKKAGFGHISPADLPRNERQIRPLIEQLEHNGERLKVWADVVATGEKPTQRLVEANPQVRANLPAPAVVEANRQPLPIFRLLFSTCPGADRRYVVAIRSPLFLRL